MPFGLHLGVTSRGIWGLSLPPPFQSGDVVFLELQARPVSFAALSYAPPETRSESKLLDPKALVGALLLLPASTVKAP